MRRLQSGTCIGGAGWYEVLWYAVPKDAWCVETAGFVQPTRSALFPSLACHLRCLSWLLAFLCPPALLSVLELAFFLLPCSPLFLLILKARLCSPLGSPSFPSFARCERSRALGPRVLRSLAPTTHVSAVPRCIQSAQRLPVISPNLIYARHLHLGCTRSTTDRTEPAATRQNRQRYQVHGLACVGDNRLHYVKRSLHDQFSWPQSLGKL